MPDGAAFNSVLPLDGADAVYAYTRDVGESADCDLQARMFELRMAEDPATGSAPAATAAFLAELRNARDRQTDLWFRQGVDMGRPSLLIARVIKDAGAATSVRVGAAASV